MAKKRQDELDYRRLLAGKTIPILVLDPKWHQLFPGSAKNARIRSLETRLNQLLKKQGKLVTDTKEMKKIKHNLMQGILRNMEENGWDKEEPEEKLRLKKQDASQRLIKEINDQLLENDKELMDLPYEIQRVNEELLVESMRVCYGRIRRYTEDIKEITTWVAETRELLKNKILEKQDKEIKNEEMYSYMHNILGANVIEIFDEANKNM